MTNEIKQIIKESEEQLFQGWQNGEVMLSEIEEFLEDTILVEEEYEIACAARNVVSRIKILKAE